MYGRRSSFRNDRQLLDDQAAIAGEQAPAIRLDSLPDVLTVREAAAVLRCSPGLIYGAVARGDITALRIRRRVVIPRRILEQLCAQVERRWSVNAGDPAPTLIREDEDFGEWEEPTCAACGESAVERVSDRVMDYLLGSA